jgi:hypothetical protein
MAGINTTNLNLGDHQTDFASLALPSDISNIQVPVAADLRSEMVRELRKAKRAQMISIECLNSNYSGSNTSVSHSKQQAGGGPLVGHQSQRNATSSPSARNLLFLLPPAASEACVLTEFVLLGITPCIDESGTAYRTLEGRLELLMLPTNRLDSTAHILPQFERQVSVNIYIYYVRWYGGAQEYCN